MASSQVQAATEVGQGASAAIPAAQWRRHLRRYGLLIALLILTLAGFTALIDPFAFVGTPDWPGVNATRFGVVSHTRTAKAYALRRQQPGTLILGSSRAESAFSPDFPGFRQQPVYNLAFSGAGVYEIYRYFQHAVALAPVQEAVIALDFTMFDARAKASAWDFAEKRLAVDAQGRPQPYPWGDALSLLLSGDALKESIASWRSQGDGKTSYFANGLRDEQFDIPEILGAYGGHRKTFLNNEQQFVCAFGAGQGDYPFVLGNQDRLAPVRQLLAYGRAHGVKVTLLIPPIHVRHLQVIHQAGLWPRFEEWKRQLAQIAAAEQTPLWDFAQANSITTEPVPPLGDNHSVMAWFRESSHARGATGALALARIYATGETPAGFGQLLIPSQLEARLAADRAALAAWQGHFGQDVAEIADLFRRCSDGRGRYASR